MRKIWLLAIAAALLTTACRIETNVLIDLNDDGSGSFGLEFGMDDEFRQIIAAQGEGLDPDAMLGGFSGAVPGATVTERTEGDMTYSVFMADFENETQFRQLIAESAGEAGDLDVRWTDDSVSIDATLDGSGDGLGGLGDLGDLGDAASDLGGDFDFDLSGGLEDFAGSFVSASVIVAMPGDIESHNADRILPDGRLQWDVPIDGSGLQISAVSGVGGGEGFPTWALLLLVLVAAAILVWLYSVQRKRKTVNAVTSAAAAAPAPPPADWSNPSPLVDDDGF